MLEDRIALEREQQQKYFEAKESLLKDIKENIINALCDFEPVLEKIQDYADSLSSVEGNEKIWSCINNSLVYLFFESETILNSHDISDNFKRSTLELCEIINKSIEHSSKLKLKEMLGDIIHDE